MAFKRYDDAQPDSWVTVGGISKKTGKKNPSTQTGYYLGRTVGKNQFDEDKDKVTFMVKTDRGVVGVNGNSNLIRRMDAAERNFKSAEGKSPLGASVVITCTGEQPSKKGNPMKLFDVQFDADDMIEVQSAGPISATEDDGGYVADTEDQDGSTYSDDNEDDEDSAQAAAQAAAERKAKVQALLAKGKNKSAR